MLPTRPDSQRQRLSLVWLVRPPTTHRQAIHEYHALRGAARLAEAIGHEDVGAGYQAEAALVKNAINTTLFDATTGLYDISDQLRGPVAQDANAMAVLFRVAPRNQRAAILQRLAAALDTPNGPLAFSPGSTILSQIISPFISSFDAWARFENGDAIMHLI